MKNLPTIPEFYRDSKILITGGSGFLGKVLIEKLLRSCPDLDTIFLLLRAKRNRDPSDRIKDITDVPLFDRLKSENPSALSKIVSVSGDVKELGLGLSEDDRQMLQREVNIVFHSAASVRFDDPLREAVLMNVRGAREMVELALGMKQLKVFMYVSTAYSNCHRRGIDVIEEVIYPPPGNWRTMIKLAEMEGQDYLLRILTPKIKETMPNTYTYSKALSENLINDYRDRLPVVIVRPSIVVGTLDEPMPGWVDNVNGPMGLWLGAWLGIIKVTLGNNDAYLDIVHVDSLIRSLIYIAWHQAVKSFEPELGVYNACSTTEYVLNKELLRRVKVVMCKFPLEQALWCPVMTMTSNQKLHFLQVVFYHMIPALLLDGMLLIQGKKTMMVKQQRRIYLGMVASKIFAMKSVQFSMRKYLELEKEMVPSDKPAFGYGKALVQDDYTYKVSLMGSKKYLLNDLMHSSPNAMKKYKIFYWANEVLKIARNISLLLVAVACARFGLYQIHKCFV